MKFSERLIEDYKIDGNLLLAKVCRGVAILMIVIALFNIIGVFNIHNVWLYVALVFSVIIALLPTLIFNVLKINKPWAQYFVLTLICLMTGAMYTVMSYHSVIMLVFPLACACFYSDKKWIVYTMGIGIPIIIICHLIAFELKIVPDEPLITMHGVIFYGIIPRLIQFIAIGLTCISISSRFYNLINNLVDKNKELLQNQRMLVTSLTELIETQSQETGQHVKRVSEYTKILCEGLEMSDEETWIVSIASMMHDVGKLIIPNEIIEKPGKLSKEEFEIIKKHVDYGKQVFEKTPGELMQVSSIIAYEHHERWDGTGYKHLKGEEISIYARCVSVADVFDALVSKRSYKEPWSLDEAYNEIISQSGKQFDPKVIEIFKNSFEDFKQVFEKYPDDIDLTIKEIINN